MYDHFLINNQGSMMETGSISLKKPTLKALDESVKKLFAQKYSLEDELYKNVTLTLREKELLENLFSLLRLPENAIFLIDVLEKIKVSFNLLQKIEGFQINPLYAEVVSVIKKISNSSTLKSDKFPILSKETTVKNVARLIYIYAAKKNKNFNSDKVNEKVNSYLVLHTDKLKRKQCIYAAMMWPLLALKSPNEEASLEANNLILGMVLNEFFEHKSNPFDGFINDADYQDWLVLRQLIDIKCLNEMIKISFYSDVENNINILLSIRISGSSCIKDRLQRVGKYLQKLRKPISVSGIKQNNAHHSTRNAFDGLGYIRLDDNLFKYDSFYYEEVLEILAINEVNNLSNHKSWEDKDEEEASLVKDEWDHIEVDDYEDEDDEVDPNDQYLIVESLCARKPNIDVSIASGQRTINQIETSNQYLYSKISKKELDKIIQIVTKISSEKSSKSNLCIGALFILCVLLFAFNPRRPPQLNLTNNNSLRSNCIVLNKDGSAISLPNLISIQYNEKLYQSMSSYTLLSMPDSLKSIIAGLADKILTKNDVFHSMGKVKKTARLLLDSAELEHLSIYDLYKFSFQNLLSLANGDAWFVGKIGQHEELVAKTQNHYSTIRERRLVEIYGNHVESLFGDQPVKLIKQSNNRAAYVGNDFMPNKVSVNSLFNEIYEAFEKVLDGNGIDDIGIDCLVDFLNLSSIYVDQLLAYSCGTRNKKDNYINPHLIDSSGFVRINDKNRSNGYHARFVFVPLDIQSELKAYEQLKAFVIHKMVNSGRQKKGSLNLSYGFLVLKPIKLNDRIKPRYESVAYTRTSVLDIIKGSIRSELSHFAALKTNANRHYLRSFFIENKLNAEFIDAYMGHWHAGTEPWQPHSLFDPVAFRESVQSHILKLVRSISLKPYLHDLLIKNHNVSSVNTHGN